MFSTMLPLLPPPSSSLLPPVHTPTNDVITQHGSHIHGGPHQQRRQKYLYHPRSSIHLLSLDERTITQRKMAIAMYGYSWLKPAGCSKTMLGRREEELEREEVERQLREVEMQERIAAEGEAEAEAERRAEMRRLELEVEANGGVVEGQPVERDLDDDIPEAEEESEEDEEDEEGGEEDMDGDLDDDIPDADVMGESSWVYDTNRDPDTESEGNDQQRTTGLAETEAMVNAMLNEDELGEIEHQHDLDDDIPNMDMDVDLDEQTRDLDDDVPEAEDEDEWQHTDTELEESEMDISVLPTNPSIGPGTTHEEMRRSSGNMMMPPPLPPQSQPNSSSRRARITPQTRAQYHTPGIDTGDSISNLISSNVSSLVGTTQTQPNNNESTDPQRNRRNWLNATGARRNLFGTFTRGTTNANVSDPGGSGFTPEPVTRHDRPSQAQTTSTSSGGLFTPSPRVVSSSSGTTETEVPRSRTRSGRLLGATGRGR